MKKITMKTSIVCFVVMCVSSLTLSAQNTNCFLDDFVPKTATIPVSVIANKTTSAPTVTVTLSADTLGKISKYVFGNALAVWMGNNTANTTFVKNVKALNDTKQRLFKN